MSIQSFLVCMYCKLTIPYLWTLKCFLCFSITENVISGSWSVDWFDFSVFSKISFYWVIWKYILVFKKGPIQPGCGCGVEVTVWRACFDSALGFSSLITNIEETYIDSLDPEKLLQCPYDKNHQIRACRFPYHLIKCKKVGYYFHNFPCNALLSSLESHIM